MSNTQPGIIAVDKKGKQVLFLDPSTYETVATLQHFPTLPHELVLSPDGRTAYIPAYGDGIHGDNPHPNHVISVVDLVRCERLADIDIRPFESPHTLRFGPDGLLYICCESDSAVVIVDPKAARVAGNIPTGSNKTHRLAVLPGKQQIWTDNEEDASITVIDLTRRSRIGTVELPQAIAGIAASADEKWVVATSAESPVLFVIDTEHARLERTIELAGHSKGSQVTRYAPDGRTLIVIGDHEPVITLFDAALQTQRTVQVGNKPMDAAFSPDGSTVLVANEDDATLSVVDIGTATVRKTVTAGKGCETLAYF